MPDELPSGSKNLKLGIVMAVSGLIVILVYSSLAGPDLPSVFAVAAVIALAALASGLFIGFLFGIPRATPVAPGPAVAGIASDGATDHQVNTNLQDISDWLTKIIVGVSLVQFGNIIGALNDIGGRFGGAFPALPTANVFIIAVVVLYFMTGLLFGFLWTRLELQLVIGLSDRSLLGRLQQKLSQENADTKLMRLVRDVVDVGKGSPPAADAIRQAIAEASADGRRLAFYRARDFRRISTSAGNLANLNRIIPVFEGLIASDRADNGGDGHYHRNYGELAFVHKDRPEHTYDRAIELLDTAIKVRDTFAQAEAADYLIYEFNRAAVRITIDVAFHQNTKAPAAVAEQVITDLKVAMTEVTLRDSVKADVQIQAWLALNGFRVDNDTIVP